MTERMYWDDPLLFKLARNVVREWEHLCDLAEYHARWAAENTARAQRAVARQNSRPDGAIRAQMALEDAQWQERVAKQARAKAEAYPTSRKVRRVAKMIEDYGAPLPIWWPRTGDSQTH